jgi:hypothetical protein
MSDHSGEQTVILTTVWWWKITERAPVSNQATKRFNMERFNLKKLNEVGEKEQYRVENPNRFAALEN